jgi:hypothetical protein
MIFMHAYVCLFICLWFMTSSEGKICWNYTVWRKGKWLEVILVLKGIYVYKGTCPPAALSFFLSSSCNVLYFIQYNYVSLYLCSPVFSSSAQPSRPPCPRPRLAKSSHLRPHRAKSRPSRAPVGITKSRVFHHALPCPSRRRPIHARTRSRAPVHTRREFPGFRFRSSPVRYRVITW